MMVDPAMIVEYAVPIIVITLAVILGQVRFWYIRCYSLRKAFKDGYAMRL